MGKVVDHAITEVDRMTALFQDYLFRVVYTESHR